MLDNESNLIVRAQAGESEAFGLLYDHYFPKIYRFIFLKVDLREEAEDLTHEVFLNSWKNIKKYELTEFPFSSWLYRIARNEVIDHYRTKKFHLVLDDLGEAATPLIPNLALDKNLDQELELQRIRRALKRLTEDQQTVIIMRFVEDLSHAEIAATLGRSEGATRLIQHRALNNLRKILSNG